MDIAFTSAVRLTEDAAKQDMWRVDDDGNRDSEYHGTDLL